MTVARKALLFCPPLAPVEVAPGARVAIGRGKECGLTVCTDDASRRHAEVYEEGGNFLVRDLGSKNGTFVNGELVGGPRALEPGDRIGVGSSQITFCRVDASLESFLANPAGHETVVFAKSAAREVIRGELSELPVFVILQMLEMGRKTGLLEIETDAGPARLWLGDGQPLHAATEKSAGMEATLTLVSATRGRFRFDASAPLPERTLQCSMTELLLEASRQIDEGGR
jgi:pSer/pThr/pTyr-binding forkhead associated (FHA) protein